MEVIRISGTGPHKVKVENDFSYVIVKHSIPGLTSNDYAEFKKISVTGRITTSKIKNEVFMETTPITTVAEGNCALGRYYYHDVTAKLVHFEMLAGVDGNVVLDEDSFIEYTVEGMNGNAHLDLIFVQEDKVSKSLVCFSTETLKKSANKQVNMSGKMLYMYSDTNVETLTERYTNGEVLTYDKATLAYMDSIAKQQHNSHFIVSWQSHARFLKGRMSEVRRVDFNLSADLDVYYVEIKPYIHGMV